MLTKFTGELFSCLIHVDRKTNAKSLVRATKFFFFSQLSLIIGLGKYAQIFIYSQLECFQRIYIIFSGAFFIDLPAQRPLTPLTSKVSARWLNRPRLNAIMLIGQLTFLSSSSIVLSIDASAKVSARDAR